MPKKALRNLLLVGASLAFAQAQSPPPVAPPKPTQTSPPKPAPVKPTIVSSILELLQSLFEEKKRSLAPGATGGLVGSITGPRDALQKSCKGPEVRWTGTACQGNVGNFTASSARINSLTQLGPSPDNKTRVGWASGLPIDPNFPIRITYTRTNGRAIWQYRSVVRYGDASVEIPDGDSRPNHTMRARGLSGGPMLSETGYVRSIQSEGQDYVFTSYTVEAFKEPLKTISCENVPRPCSIPQYRATEVSPFVPAIHNRETELSLAFTSFGFTPTISSKGPSFRFSRNVSNFRPLSIAAGFAAVQTPDVRPATSVGPARNQSASYLSLWAGPQIQIAEIVRLPRYLRLTGSPYEGAGGWRIPGRSYGPNFSYRREYILDNTSPYPTVSSFFTRLRLGSALGPLISR